MAPLARFVKTCRQLLKSSSIDAFVFVCGNEAGGRIWLNTHHRYIDLDSTVSALAYAYIFRIHQRKPLIPFINISNLKILEMRGEVKMAIREMGIDMADLLFSNEIFSIAQKSQVKPSFFLVDHNEVSGFWGRKFSKIDFSIVGIIDHHQDAGEYLSALPRLIHVCGSTASLIVRRAIDTNDSDLINRCQSLSKPLLLAIIYDTVNLSWRQQLVDEEAVAQLLQWQEGKPDTNNRSTIMKQLEDAVDEAAELSFDIDDLLHKDYKLYSHEPASGRHSIFYGISTLHTSFREMIADDKEVWQEKVRNFIIQEQIELLVITSAIRERSAKLHYSELGIIFGEQHKHLASELYEVLQDEALNLDAIIEEAGFSLYDQKNTTISRKQLHPIIKSFLAAKFL